MNGVKFGDYHSYNNLGLVLGPFSLSPATPQLNFLKIPGRNGYLDLTEANGGVKYNSREFTFTFTAVPSEYTGWADVCVSKVERVLHGKRLPIIFDRSPGCRWIGRCVVDSYHQDKNVFTIVVKATVDPQPHYRSSIGVPGSYYETTDNIVIKNGTSHVISPVEVEVSGIKSAVIVFGGEEYTVEPGNAVIDVRLVPGENSFTVTHTGTITLSWWEDGGA